MKQERNSAATSRGNAAQAENENPNDINKIPVVERLPSVSLLGSWVNGEPLGEMWTGTEILARLDCAGQPWAHLRLDESGWCQVVEDGDTGSQCFESISGYVVLLNDLSVPPLGRNGTEKPE